MSNEVSIEVFNQPPQPQKKVVRLKLEQNGNGVDLAEVDNSGNVRRYLLQITEYGVGFYYKLPEDFGIKVEGGKLAIIK